MPQPRGFWTPARDAVLRERYPSDPKAAAAALGVTLTSARTRANRIGVSTGRVFWNPADDATLRELYPTHTAAELARKLGQKVKAVQNRAVALGLRKFGDRDGLLPRVRELHGRGLTDTDIANELGAALSYTTCPRREVTRLRDRLQLSPNAEAVLDARRRGVKTQAAVLGIRPGGDLRKLAFRRFAAQNGWPDDLPPRCVQILNVLAEHGPRTKAQLAEALGLPWRGLKNRDLLVSRSEGGSYVTTLLRRGLALHLPGAGLRPSRGEGRGRLPGRYMLSPAAVQWRERWLAEQQQQQQQEADCG